MVWTGMLVNEADTKESLGQLADQSKATEAAAPHLLTVVTLTLAYIPARFL